MATNISTSVAEIEKVLVSLELMSPGDANGMDDADFDTAIKGALRRVSSLVEVKGMPKDYSYSKGLGLSLIAELADPENQKKLQQLEMGLQNRGTDLGEGLNFLSNLVSRKEQKSIDQQINEGIEQPLRKRGVSEDEIKEVKAKLPQLLNLAKNANTFVRHMNAITDYRLQKTRIETIEKTIGAPVTGVYEGATEAAVKAKWAEWKKDGVKPEDVPKFTAVRQNLVDLGIFKKDVLTQPIPQPGSAAPLAAGSTATVKPVTPKPAAAKPAGDKAPETKTPPKEDKPAEGAGVAAKPEEKPAEDGKKKPETDEFGALPDVAVKAPGADGAPSTAGAAPSSPPKKPNLTDLQKNRLHQAFAANPAAAPLMDEILHEFTRGWRIGELMEGEEIPGLDRKGKPALPETRPEKLQILFKEAFAGGKSFDDVKSNLMQSVDRMGMLPFGSVERRDAYKKLIDDAFAEAQKAGGADKFDVDKSAKAFADYFNLDRLEELKKQKGLADFLQTSVNSNRAYTIDPAIANASDLAQSQKVHTLKNEGMRSDRRLGILYINASGDAVIEGVERDSNIYTRMKMSPEEVTKFRTMVADAKLGDSTTVTDDAGYYALRDKWINLDVKLKHEFPTYRFARDNMGSQFIDPQSFITQVGGALTLPKAEEKYTAEAKLTREIMEKAKREDAEFKAEQDAKKSGKPVSNIISPTGQSAPVSPGSPAAGGASSTAPVILRTSATQPAPSSSAAPQNRTQGMSAAQIMAPEIKARNNAFDQNTESESFQHASNLRSSIFVSVNRTGQTLVEFVDKNDKVHVMDATPASDFIRSICAKPDQEILQEMMGISNGGGRRSRPVEVPSPGSNQFLIYMDKYAKKHGINLEETLRSYPAIKAVHDSGVYSELTLGPALLVAATIEKKRSDLTYTNGVKKDEHRSAPSVQNSPDPYIDDMGHVKVRYLDKAAGKEGLLDVSHDLKYLATLETVTLEGQKTPRLTDKNFAKFGEAYAEKYGIDFAERMPAIAALQKNYPGMSILELAIRIEKDHPVINGSPEHRGGLQGEWDRAQTRQLPDAPTDSKQPKKVASNEVQDDFSENRRALLPGSLSSENSDGPVNKGLGLGRNG